MHEVKYGVQALVAEALGSTRPFPEGTYVAKQMNSRLYVPNIQPSTVNVKIRQGSTVDDSCPADQVRALLTKPSPRYQPRASSPIKYTVKMSFSPFPFLALPEQYIVNTRLPGDRKEAESWDWSVRN